MAHEMLLATGTPIEAIGHNDPTMFTADGVMPADGLQTVLDVLKPSNEAVKARADQIDLSKTFTTEFVKNAS